MDRGISAESSATANLQTQLVTSNSPFSETGYSQSGVLRWDCEFGDLDKQYCEIGAVCEAPASCSGDLARGNSVAILASATPNQKRKKSMSFRSGQSGTVVRKGRIWHGRYYVDLPNEENRRKVSVSLGPIEGMTKTQAKRKLRSMLEKMGLNDDHHL